MESEYEPNDMIAALAMAKEAVSRFFSCRIDDPSHGTIEIHGDRYLLIRGASLSIEFFDLVRSLYPVDQQGDADDLSRTILFDLAHAVGRTDAQNFSRTMHLDNTLTKLASGTELFAHAGWASVEVSLDSNIAIGDECRLQYDHPYSFESDAWVRAGRKTDFPVCIMNAGYSSGWCEASLGDTKLVSVELLCRAKGDETCRFIAAPPHRIAGHIKDYLSRNPQYASRVISYRVSDFFGRKREEEALKRRQEELERELRQTQKLEALGRLAGGIAHDFNNLISVILGQAMLAQRRVKANDPLANDLTKIVRASERAAALTQQLLAFGRSQVARNEVLDLNAVVESTTHMIERVIGDDIELTLQLAADAGCVNADRGQLEQVLMNLAVNARDAMPSGGKLLISTRRERQSDGSSSAILQVKDNGIGMDEEVRARAFEPFYSTKGSHGTGLGLSTVYGIIQNAGGSITIESAPHQGCDIRVALPTSEQPVQPAAIPSLTNNAVGAGTVLVVDDNAEVLDTIVESLRSLGYDPLAATNVDVALTLLADTRQRIDVMITDIVMPRMNGIELASRATQLRPTLKVLYMSGHAPDPKHRELLANGGASFLQKPFTPQMLAQRLAAVSLEI